MLAAAKTPGSLFTAVQPEESGLDCTIYASETPEYPVVIVDHRPGKEFSPDDAATVLALGETSGVPLIDRWLAANWDALRAYCSGHYDTVDFYAAMLPILGR